MGGCKSRREGYLRAILVPMVDTQYDVSAVIPDYVTHILTKMRIH